MIKLIQLENDIVLFGINADSFPQGVSKAWQQLHQQIPSTDRNFYGISHGTPDGTITYMACVAEAFTGEAEQLDYYRFILPKGKYIATTITDYPSKMHKIGEAFAAILNRKDYDKNGCCVEWYTNEKDVVCMVKQIEN